MRRLRLPSLGLRHLAALPAAGLLAAALVLPGTASAATSADTIVNVHYPVTSGTTFIKKLNSTVQLGPGTLSAAVDITNNTLQATLSLPPATASARVLGLPVTATVTMIQNGPASGTLDFNNNTVTSTASITLKLSNLKIAGLPVPVGDSCESKSPTSVTLSSDPGFNLGNGGTISGTYTIPPFDHCGLATLLLNLTIPGPGNTISLTLGALQLG